MNEIEIFKALSNETRLNIMKWLKDPDENFPVQIHRLDGDISFERGVCVGSICEKAGISQSVTSQYLDTMERAGLLESARIGKWTYYRRNEEFIQEFVNKLQIDL